MAFGKYFSRVEAGHDSMHVNTKSLMRRSAIDSTDDELSTSSFSAKKQLGKWKRSQTKRIQFEEMVHEPGYNEFRKNHELEIKATLPLPLITAIEREVLQILESSIKDYHRHLGKQHNLSQQMRNRIQDLRLMIDRKGILDEEAKGRCHRIVEFFRQFLGAT